MSSKPTWMVRAGRDAYRIGDFRDKGVVAVGWGQLRPLTDYKCRKAIEQAIAAATLEQSRQQHLTAASQLDRFRAAMQVGDRVVSYDPQRREYLLGR